MAINNHWQKPVYDSPRGFSVWCIVAKLSAIPIAFGIRN